MQTLINIVVMIAILGVLISLHEAGHLGMAKLFKVYCFEYSIGFGPKFLHVKRKDGETYFSLRAFPIGGFVSMYGEEGAVPEGENEPPAERSLENKKLYQKLLIMSAGVVVNYLLGLVLIFISVSCFHVYYQGYSYSRATDNGDRVVSAYILTKAKEGSAIKSYFENSDELKNKNPDDYVVYLGPSYSPDGATAYRVFDGDVEVTIDERTIHYAAIYSPKTLTKARDLLKDITLYPLATKDGALVETSDSLKSAGIPYEIELNANRSLSVENVKSGNASMNLQLTLLPKSENSIGIISDEFDEAWSKRLVVTLDGIKNGEKSWESSGIEVETIAYRKNWNEAWQEWAHRVPEANVVIVKGLTGLFTPKGIQQVSGIVGMTAEVGVVMSMGGASMLFLYAGIISINLAFFNLLPFPGLDGWQIIVSIIEGATRKKISSKAKGLISIIGLGLLMVLMVVVAVKDIVGLF